MYYGEMTTGKPHGKGNLSYYFLNKSLKIGTLIEKYGIILEGIFEHGEMKWGTVYTYNREGMICTQTGCMR